ncbi:MAG: hypothetical protein NBV63_01565 [Candidatus Pacebacteria bacterium]|nr:hypothetical protein [Candidatus Paceibacterota bacterium]
MVLRTIGVFLIAGTLLCAPGVSFAADELTITPVIIDEKAKIRDILKETITVTNAGERVLRLYPSVFDVSPVEGQADQFVRAEDSLERSVSLANWIELSRGVIELGPGESKEIPFVIRVNLNATPGKYYAHVTFGEGSTRDDSDATEPLGTVTVNVEVQADIKEVLQLGSFFTDNIFFSGDDILFNYQIENIGNQNLKPNGEIRVYDRRGVEVASIPVNQDGASFTPEQKALLASVWSGAEGFGKYKAFLDISYGSNQTASVQDTIYFWIVPWKELAAFFTIGALLVIFFVYSYHRKLERRYALAHAGAHPPRMTYHEEPLRRPQGRTWAGYFGFGAQAPARPVYTEPQEVRPLRKAAPVREVLPPTPAVPEVHRTVLHVTAPRAQTTGTTINLKDLRHPARGEVQHEPHEIHVINLKK